MTLVVPAERLHEMLPPPAQQAQHVLEDGDANQVQHRKALPAVQQAGHVMDGGMDPKECGSNEDGSDAAESLEKAAHPQHIGGQTFFDAQEGETLPL